MRLKSLLWAIQHRFTLLQRLDTYPNFSGSLEGNNYYFTNFTIKGLTNQGLFANTVAGSEVKNITFRSGSATGSDRVAVVAASAAGTTIQNITNCLNVSGTSYVAGVVGEASSSAHLHNLGNITATSQRSGGIAASISGSTIQGVANQGVISGNTLTGGVFGYAYTTPIPRPFNRGDVTGTSEVGGIVGAANASLMTYAVNLGKISGLSYVGGIEGDLHAATNGQAVDNAQNFGIVTATGDSAGGIVGASQGNMNTILTNLSNTGAVSGGSKVGGIIGAGSDLGLNSVSNAGNVTASGSEVGGIYGSMMYYDTFDYTLLTATNSGTVTGVDKVGGIVGYLGHRCPLQNVVNTSTATVQGRNFVGGIAGQSVDNSNVKVTNATNAAAVKGVAQVGGIFGRTSDLTLIGTIANSGAITATGDNVGGIIGIAYFYDDSISYSNLSNTGAVTGANQVGGIFGTGPYNTSLTSCINGPNATVSGINYVGGLVGLFTANSNALVYTSENNANVTGAAYVGGIFGSVSDGGFLTVVNRGNVTGSGDYVGGIVGENNFYDTPRTIDSTRNYGSVSGGNWVGGIYGLAPSSHTMSNTKNFGATVRGLNNVGGLVGQSPVNSNLTISTTENRASVTGGGFVGGIIGQGSDVFFSDAENSGNITGTGDYVGGIVGRAQFYDNRSTMTNITNLGQVIGASYVSGISGHADVQDFINVSNSGNVSGTNYVSGVLSYTATNSNTAMTTVTNTGNVSGASYVGGIIAYVNDFGTLNGIHNSGTVTSSGPYAAGLVALQTFYDNWPNRITNGENTGNVTGTNFVGGLVGSGVIINLSWLYNSGAVTGSTTVGSTNVGGIAGLLDSSAINVVANIGDVVGRQYVAGGIGLAKAASNAGAGVSNFANRGSVRGVSDVGGIVGNATLVYPYTISNSVNYNSNVLLDCATNCGSSIGIQSGGTFTQSSVYSVSQNSTTSNTLGTNLKLSLSAFSSGSNFIAAPPSGGAAFGAAYWGYSLNYDGNSGLAWLAGMPW